jgi:Tol biopolymer transport system component
MAQVPQALANAMQDRYRLERELGSGGMATVYLAHDLRHGRQVAVKVLHPELSALLGGDRFLSEIKTTAALQHPHILPLFDSGDANGNLFYVMPLVEGETLRSRLNREKQLPIADAVRLAREVSGALDYAHRHGVIHRDIKPENILLHDGRAVVADFGIALAVQSAGGQRMTQTGLSLGTPQYMSPEQAMGEREITARSDIYALGVVVYEMLTGDPPFTGSTTQSIVARVLTEEPRPIGPQRKSVPEAVEAAVLTALEKLPADRFGSAAEFAAALGGEGTTQTGARTRGRVAAKAGRASAPSRLPVLAVALLLTAGLAAWGWLRPRSVPEAPVTRYQIELPASYAPTYGSRVAVSPDGSRIVYRGPGPQGSQLWLRSRDKVEAVPIPGTTGAVHPFFSPDGTRLAYSMDAPSVLMSIRLDGGLPTELARSVGLAGGSWSRDGYIYVDGLGRTLLRIPESGGAAADAATPDSASGEEEINMPFALPNGRGVIVTIHRSYQSDSWMVGVLDTRTGKHRQLMPGVAGYYLSSGHLLVVNTQGELSAVPFDQNSLEITGDPTVIDRNINIAGWRVDMGAGEDVVAYALESTAQDSLELGWTTGDASYQPVAPGWVDAITSFSPSPDGKSIAFSVARERPEVWIRRLDNGALTRLSLGSAFAGVPTWSRDSRTVYYSVVRDKWLEVVARPADGSSGETSLARSSLFLSRVTTSVDGSRLVYMEFNNESFTNLMMLVQGDTVPKPLLSTPLDEAGPAISPDGRWLAFSSNERGGTTDHVYVRPFPNVMETVWQVSPEAGFAPRWSPDGREILYMTGENAIAAVEVLPGPTFALGRRRTVLSLAPYQSGMWQWSVGKDGRLMVLKRLSAPRDLKIMVTHNLGAELRTAAVR